MDEFVKALPVKKIYGVGKVTATRMNAMGLHTCADLREWSEDSLLENFGKFGSNLYRLCRGIDDREVRTDSQRKSLSVENTYAQDLPTLESCLEQLPVLHQQMQERLQRVLKKYRVSKKYVKIKFLDFVSTTAEHSADNCDLTGYEKLLTDAWHRGERPVRLLGVGVGLSPLQPETVKPEYKIAEQLVLPGVVDHY